MILGIIIEFVVGLVLIILGFIIWIKQKTNLLHDYHYKKVNKEDIPAYTRLIGIGLIIIGIGIITTGIVNLLNPNIFWIPLVSGIVIGLMFIIIAQIKYNGSIIS